MSSPEAESTSSTAGAGTAAASPQPSSARSQPVSAPPAHGAPTRPAGFVPLDRFTSGPLLKPAPTQVAGGSAVAAEIAASTTYADDFTGRAPTADRMATALRIAEAWTNEERASASWHEYASAQKQIAWDDVARLVRKLQKEFKAAIAHDATIEPRYPELSRFLRARQVIAAKANLTKSAHQKAADAEAATPPAAPAPAPAAAAPSPPVTAAKA